jgi:fructose-1-phosphate kinase PfkB-like protein
VVNPVGAGDCLVAGLAWGLSTGADLRDSIPAAIAMAAASCETYFAGHLDNGRFHELRTAVTAPSLSAERG